MFVDRMVMLVLSNCTCPLMTTLETVNMLSVTSVWTVPCSPTENEFQSVPVKVFTLNSPLITTLLQSKVNG